MKGFFGLIVEPSGFLARLRRLILMWGFRAASFRTLGCRAGAWARVPKRGTSLN